MRWLRIFPFLRLWPQTTTPTLIGAGSDERRKELTRLIHARAHAHAHAHAHSYTRFFEMYCIVYVYHKLVYWNRCHRSSFQNTMNATERVSGRWWQWLECELMVFPLFTVINALETVMVSSLSSIQQSVVLFDMWMLFWGSLTLTLIISIPVPLSSYL